MKNKFKKILLSNLILCSVCSCSPEVNNKLHGLYVIESDSKTNVGFQFDGNGKVKYSDEGFGYFFTKDDSLIICSDNEIFRFKIQKNKIISVSENNKKETWVKKNAIIPNNRINDAKAKNTATLLNEYYEIMTDNLSNDFSGNDKKTIHQKNKLIQLCDQGLSQACMAHFGILLIDDQLLRTNPNAKKTAQTENSAIVALGNKIISQGEPKGYSLLGIYYQIIGNKKKAIQQYKLGAENGDKTASLELINIQKQDNSDSN